MQDYERLGVFYLGRRYDLAARKTLPDLLLYDSNDLLTHALCVGMTGSGKTGLCVDLIEEAAIDGVPSILVDPKGDLTNLLLAFPDLRPADFEPWVDADVARKQGSSVAEFAAQQAELWRKGLADWQQDGDRIRRLRDAAETCIYTPGSNAGTPVSILSSFAAPSKAVLEDAELLAERVRSTVAGLLGLVGIASDAVRGREAVFLATILQKAWQDGRDLDLGALIQEIQSPSVRRVGVMDVETFYPAKERFALATAINGLLATPGFDTWLSGEPLDVQRILYTPAGKPRVAVFSIAHLGDEERMFFVTLLLNQVLAWMRAQTGTTSLRALVYMDEIFGFFPPVANPPSKLPLLTLLKQARAFGVGVVLATQNPVDLDYKGLSNIGTWFLGRLQTDRDKQRVLDGLEGAAATQGSAFDRAAMEQTLSALGSRVFLLHDVHEEGPTLFESRWAMSYLRGPLTRDQIRALMEGRRATGPTASPSAAPAARTPATGPAASAERPALPPAIPQYFVPARGPGAVVYEPLLLGAAQVRYADAKAKVDVRRSVLLVTPVKDGAVPVDWSEAREIELDPSELETAPAEGASFGELAPAASVAKNYAAWSKDFVAALRDARKLTLLRSTRLGETSLPDETEGEFRVRLQQRARELRDAAAAKLREKYASRIAALRERLRRAEQAVEREAGQARSAKISTALSFGSTLLGAFLGRKVVSATNVRKAGTALRGVGRSLEQSQDVERAGETVEAIQQALADLDARFQAEIDAAEGTCDPAREALETIEVRPSKTDVSVKLVALAWAPHYALAR